MADLVLGIAASEPLAVEPSPTRHAIVLSVAPVGSRADGVPLVLALTAVQTRLEREGERRGPSRLALASPLGLAFSGLFTFFI